MFVIRTYETYEVEFTNEDGSVSTWTNYDRADAERIASGSRPARVVRRTFDVVFDMRVERDRRLLAMAKPGVAERTEVAA
jgi:hypothetical protein